MNPKFSDIVDAICVRQCRNNGHTVAEIAAGAKMSTNRVASLLEMSNVKSKRNGHGGRWTAAMTGRRPSIW